MAAATCAPAFATNPTAAVKVTYTVTPTTQLSIVTDYSSSFTQGSTAPSLLPSATGVCSGSGSEQADNLSFGSLSLLGSTSATYVGCDYQNAIAAEVVTNDSSGYMLKEFVVPASGSSLTGVAFCAYPNFSGESGTDPGQATTPTTSSLSGNPAAYTGTPASGCGATAAGGFLGVGSGLTNSTPGQSTPVGGGSGTGSLATATPPGSNYFVFGSSGSAATSGVFFGEDLQINLQPSTVTAGSAAQAAFVILCLIPS